jgi:hypothetical protein
MYSATGPASDRSALVVVTDRANSSAVGGNARWRSPEVAEEVLMRTSERTRAGVARRKPLREHPACRNAYDVRGRDAAGVEHARGVGCKVGDDGSRASWRGR